MGEMGNFGLNWDTQYLHWTGWKARFVEGVLLDKYIKNVKWKYKKQYNKPDIYENEKVHKNSSPVDYPKCS
jgi:hypothetical protein